MTNFDTTFTLPTKNFNENITEIPVDEVDGSSLYLKAAIQSTLKNDPILKKCIADNANLSYDALNDMYIKSQAIERYKNYVLMVKSITRSILMFLSKKVSFLKNIPFNPENIKIQLTPQELNILINDVNTKRIRPPGGNIYLAVMQSIFMNMLGIQLTDILKFINNYTETLNTSTENNNKNNKENKDKSKNENENENENETNKLFDLDSPDNIFKNKMNELRSNKAFDNVMNILETKSKSSLPLTTTSSPITVKPTPSNISSPKVSSPINISNEVTEPPFKSLQHNITFKRKLSETMDCLLYTSPSPRDRQRSRMPSSA